VPSVKSGPHWIRSRLVDPATGLTVPDGERGILAHCDLGNFNSVTTILTEDVGEPADSGLLSPSRLKTKAPPRGAASDSAAWGHFLLLGRAEGAQAKGCSLAVEEFIRSTAS